MSFDRFKVDKPTALMSRLDEIIKSEMSESAALRTLAAEVDARDEVIGGLLEMLNTNTKPRPKHEDFHPFDYEQWNDAVCQWDRNAERYARAVAIAEGRTE